MVDSFRAELLSWQTFYFTMGGASAALIGLMLVALSLGIRIVSKTTIADIKAFATPSVLYFVWVLMLSAVMLVPAEAPTFLVVILFPSGIIGLIWSFPYIRRLIRTAIDHQDFLISDWLSQVILPIGGFVLLILASVGFLADQHSLAFGGIWLASIALVIAAITNTWSMVVWIIEHQRESDEDS